MTTGPRSIYIRLPHSCYVTVCKLDKLAGHTAVRIGDNWQSQSVFAMRVGVYGLCS